MKKTGKKLWTTYKRKRKKKAIKKKNDNCLHNTFQANVNDVNKIITFLRVNEIGPEMERKEYLKTLKLVMKKRKN